MADISHQCPHCGTEKAALLIAKTLRADARTWHVFAGCKSCGEPVLLWVVVPNGGNLIDDRFDRVVSGIVVDKTSPAMVFPRAPEHTPMPIEALYVEASKVHRAQHFNAAAPLFRRVLEAALKALHADGRDRVPLFKRIENLPLDVGVTPAMKKWAHAVRLIGNDGAHEDGSISEADANDIREFTELFLTYAFTLPARIAAMTERRENKAS